MDSTAVVPSICQTGNLLSDVLLTPETETLVEIFYEFVHISRNENVKKWC